MQVAMIANCKRSNKHLAFYQLNITLIPLILTTLT